MSKLVIFGAGSFGQVANYLFTRDSEHEVVAHTVHAEHLDDAASRVEGVEVVPFESVQREFPPDEHLMFVAVGQTGLNRVRERIYGEAKGKGFELATYISSRCTWWGESIGDNCFIFEDNTIQPFVKIGNDVVLWSGNHIGHHSEIGDHVFLTSHIVVSGHCRIGAYSFLGVNATVRDTVSIAESSVIGAGALVMKSTKPGEVYIAPRTKKAPMRAEDLKI